MRCELSYASRLLPSKFCLNRSLGNHNPKCAYSLRALSVCVRSQFLYSQDGTASSLVLLKDGGFSEICERDGTAAEAEAKEMPNAFLSFMARTAVALVMCAGTVVLLTAASAAGVLLDAPAESRGGRGAGGNEAVDTEAVGTEAGGSATGPSKESLLLEGLRMIDESIQLTLLMAATNMPSIRSLIEALSKE